MFAKSVKKRVKTCAMLTTGFRILDLENVWYISHNYYLIRIPNINNTPV